MSDGDKGEGGGKSPAIKQLQKKSSINTTISHQKRGGKHNCLLVSRLRGVGPGKTRPRGCYNECTREGRETSIIDNDKGEADKTTTMCMVTIRRDDVAVASVRGTMV